LNLTRWILTLIEVAMRTGPTDRRVGDDAFSFRNEKVDAAA